MGTPIFIIGPSGAGKSTLMQHAAAHHEGCVIAPRLCTRSPNYDEHDEFITEENFHTMKAQGCLLLDWYAHDLKYGFTRSSIEHLLQKYELVLFNGARRAVSDFFHIFPRGYALVINATIEARRARLAERARESTIQQEKRLEAFSWAWPEDKQNNCFVIDNSHDLNTAYEEVTSAFSSIKESAL